MGSEGWVFNPRYRLMFISSVMLLVNSVCLSVFSHFLFSSIEVPVQHLLLRSHGLDPGGFGPLSGLDLSAFPCLESEERRPRAAGLGDRGPVDPRRTGAGRGDPRTGGRVQEQPGKGSWSWSEGRRRLRGC